MDVAATIGDWAARKLSLESCRPWSKRGDAYPAVSTGGGMTMYGALERVWRTISSSVDANRVWLCETS